MHRVAGGGAPDDAVGTLSQLLCYIVTLVDDELLVEHLQAVSTRAGNAVAGPSGCTLNTLRFARSPIAMAGWLAGGAGRGARLGTAKRKRMHKEEEREDEEPGGATRQRRARWGTKGKATKEAGRRRAEDMAPG